MLKIKSFLFNPIMENTYLLYDESHEGVVIDPGNVSEKEDETLSGFIGKENITIKYVLNTHPHVDHTYGNDFCKRHFHAELLMSEAGLSVYRYAPHYCVAFGLDAPDFPEADRFVSEGDEIVFGHQ
ncbi:MAG: MBL fold metallo-hydrolase, partial [Clostridia bacterium]|nr:MBL fold metallo-hydrolase [Clostridia bacterium]